MSATGTGRRTRLQLWRHEARVLLDRVRATLRIGRAPSSRPLPRVGVALGAWLPGWVLRTAVAAVALGCTALLHPGPAISVLAILGALVLLIRSSGVVAAAYAVALGFRLAVSPAPAGSTEPYLLLFGVHLLLALARVSSLTPWTAKVDLRVLVPPLRRFLVLQVLVQLLALGGARLSSSTATVPWLGLGVGIALTLLAWWLLSRMIGPPQRRRSP